jgi:type I restriction enzyme S subunit
VKWVERKIGELCNTGSGGTPSRDRADDFYGGSIPWVKSGELRESIITETTETLTEAGLTNSSAKIVPAGALLVAMYGATVGRVGILGIDAATNQAICNIVPRDSDIHTRYLFHCLQWKLPVFLSRSVGGAQPNISQEIIRETLVPLPPLEEQRRIAAILDKADALRQKRRLALQKLDSLTQSIFLDMFGDPVANPKGWAKMRFGNIADCKLGKMLDSSRQTGESAYPYLRNANVQWNRLDLDSLLTMDFDENDRQKFTLQSGDLLICEGGEPGRAAVWNDEITNCFYQKALHRCRINANKGLAKFYVFLLWELSKRKSLHYSTSTIGHLTAEKLDELILVNPPFDLQKEFVDRVDVAEHNMRRMNKSFVQLDSMFTSLQSRAFRGDL